MLQYYAFNLEVDTRKISCLTIIIIPCPTLDCFFGIGGAVDLMENDPVRFLGIGFSSAPTVLVDGFLVFTLYVQNKCSEHNTLYKSEYAKY